MDNERTILDPQATQTNTAANSAQNNMSTAEKAAYTAAGAAVGAGATFAAKAGTTPTDIKTELPTAEEAEALAANAADKAYDKADDDILVSAADETDDTPEVQPEVLSTTPSDDSNLTGVTVETGTTTVHVEGNANIDIEDGKVHIEVANPEPAPTPDDKKDTPTETDVKDDITTEPKDKEDTPTETEDVNPEDVIIATATGVRVAQVNDDDSFAQAFADARAQVGPGGVFEWHGRIYGTYFKDEWETMTPDERQQFQASINPEEIQGTNANENLYAGNNPEVHPHGNEEEIIPKVLEVGEYDVDEDGVPDPVALIEVNGQEIIIVDIDHDNIADIALAEVDGEVEVEYIAEAGIIMPETTNTDIYLAENGGDDFQDGCSDL